MSTDADLAVRAKGVTKAFGDDGILEGADLEVREGEILVLLGPNGVGKTVLLSCLAGATAPSEGSVEVFERPVADDGGDSLCFMLQETMSVETLTGRENARYYSRLHPRFEDRWEEYAADFELDDDLDKRVEHYSEGMKRKLEFALALSVDVPLYLLDEPTAGVDLSMVQRFHDAILERNAEGKTFVVSSHRPMDAELADRVAVVAGGGITATGAPGELLESVPTVVRASGSEAVDAAEDCVVDGRTFRVGAEARGYLRPDESVADVRGQLPDRTGVHVETTEPTFTDLFNYYVHVR